MSTANCHVVRCLLSNQICRLQTEQKLSSAKQKGISEHVTRAEVSPIKRGRLKPPLLREYIFKWTRALKPNKWNKRKNVND